MLVELESARVFFANRAAHRMAGGEFPLAPAGDAYHRVYVCFDSDGRRIPDAEMPGVRAARGERFANERIDWETPDGTLSLLVAGGTIEPPGGRRVGVVTFEDVTAVAAERRRTDALSEAGALMAAPLDAAALAPLIAQLTVPRVADWCAVELGGRRIATAPEVPPALPEDPLRIPLQVRGRELGALLIAGHGGRRLGTADLAIAQELADRCALYLDNARLYEELRAARDELEAILAGVADAVTVQAPDGRLRYVNDEAVRLLGVPIGLDTREALLAAEPSVLAAGYDMLGEDGEPFPHERLPGRLALAGAEAEPVIVRYRVRATGESRWSRLKAQPLRNPSGDIILAINVVEDITDLKEAEERQRLLAEAGRVLSASLDYEETLARVAWLMVPELGDWCMVDLVVARGLQRVAVAHADPEKAALAGQMQGLAIDPSGAEGPAAVARSGRPELHPHVDDAHLAAAARSPEHHRLVTEIGVRSALSVPMTAGGERLGVLTLSTAESGRVLGAEQLALAEELARRAAIAVDNARVHRQRSQIAQTLQRSLLPPMLPEIAGIDTAALYRPAGQGTEVGGDFYDLFTVAESEWIAVIGDVCGKGAEAAAVTALARYTIRTAAVRRRSPARILAWLNDAMCREDLDGRFCTITLVYLDTSRARIRVAAACGGHPPALLRRVDGTVEDLGGPGTLLGLLPDPVLEDQRAELGPGDALLLHTDGITEARAPEWVLSEAALRAAVAAAPGGSAAALVEHVTAVALGEDSAPPRDDIAVLALRATG